MMEAVHMREMVKVWPLKGGLKGLTAEGYPCTLMPGIAGWMHESVVAEAEGRGDVQTMIGLRPQDLKEPELHPDGTPRKRRRKVYQRRDMSAETDQEPVPFINGKPPVPPGTTSN